MLAKSSFKYSLRTAQVNCSYFVCFGFWVDRSFISFVKRTGNLAFCALVEINWQWGQSDNSSQGDNYFWWQGWSYLSIITSLFRLNLISSDPRSHKLQGGTNQYDKLGRDLARLIIVRGWKMWNIFCLLSIDNQLIYVYSQYFCDLYSLFSLCLTSYVLFYLLYKMYVKFAFCFI